MEISVFVFILAIFAIIFFFKSFYAFVYFIVATDIFLRIVTYLKMNILRDDAFGFLSAIPSDVPSIINGFDLGMFNDILMAFYIVVYIVFEVLLITKFVSKKF